MRDRESIKTVQWGWNVEQLVECLPCIHEAQGRMWVELGRTSSYACSQRMAGRSRIKSSRASSIHTELEASLGYMKLYFKTDRQTTLWSFGESRTGQLVNFAVALVHSPGDLSEETFVSHQANTRGPQYYIPARLRASNHSRESWHGIEPWAWF